MPVIKFTLTDRDLCELDGVHDQWLIDNGFRPLVSGGFKRGIVFIWRGQCGNYFVQISGTNTKLESCFQVRKFCNSLGLMPL